MAEEEAIATAEVQCALLGLPNKDIPRLAFAITAWGVVEQAYADAGKPVPDAPERLLRMSELDASRMVRDALRDVGRGVDAWRVLVGPTMRVRRDVANKLVFGEKL